MANCVITKSAKRKMVLAHAGIISVIPKIVGVAFGDGAVNGTVIRIPLDTDNALQHELLRKEIDNCKVREDEVSVVYTCTLTKSTLAGKNINEAALYDVDGELVAINTFSNKGKDDDMEMVFNLIDTFEEG